MKIFIPITVFILIAFWWYYSTTGKNNKAKMEFESREPDDFETFLAGLDFIPQENERELIRQVRQIIVEYGEVSETSIRATDTFGDSMIHLPGWDSVDWLDIMLSLEEITNRNIDRAALLDIPEMYTREGYRQLTIARFIWVMVEYCRSHPEPSLESKKSRTR